MAARTGKSGLVEYKGVPVLRINNWNANINIDMRDHTSFTTGPLQWRVTKPGLAGGSGTFAGFWDADGSTAQNDAIDAALAGSTGTIKLSADKETGGSFDGAVFFSGLTGGSAVDGDATIGFDFTFNGAVTFSTTTS